MAIATNNGTVKDKANHAVVLDKTTADKLNKDVQSYRLITVATLVDRLKINGSLARRALTDLEERGQIKKVVGHSKLTVYSTSILYFSAACSTSSGGCGAVGAGTGTKVFDGDMLTMIQHERLERQTKRLERMKTAVDARLGSFQLFDIPLPHYRSASS